MFLKDCCLFSIFLCGTAFCQSSDDSLHHTFAPPITVTIDAEIPEILIHPIDLHSETAEQLSLQTGATRISDALQVLHPSLDIRNYGSLGGLSFASFRGLPIEYTSVYWEGIKITNSQNSLTDFNLIDLKSVSSVGIISAANAQLIGGDVGGAGILLSSNSTLKPSGFDISSSVVSYNDLSSLGEKQADFVATIKPIQNLSFSGGLTTTYSNGVFPFRQDNGNIINRENNDAHLFNANLSGNYIIDETANLKSFSFFTRSEHGVPGATTIDNRGASLFNARQSDENFLSALSFQHAPLSAFEYTLSVAYQSQNEIYTDPAHSTTDQFLNRIFSFVWKSKTILTDWSDLYAGIDYTKNLLFSNQIALASGDTNISREQYAAYLSDKIKFFDHFDATASLRTELQSDINKPQVLPGISLYYSEPKTSLILQLSYGRLYHAPTFNDLYWKAGDGAEGNPNLLSENGDNFEFTASLPLLMFERIFLKLQATYFRTDLNNQIVWQELPSGIWYPSNVEMSHSEGIEFTGEIRYSVSEKYNLLLREGLSLIRTKDLSSNSIDYGNELPYSTPMRSIFLLELQNPNIGSLDITALYRGHRFTTLANNEELPAMIKYDAVFSSIPFTIVGATSIAFQFSVHNIANAQFQETLNYPLPGRIFKFGISLTHY